jgi:hypothetical protein
VSTRARGARALAEHLTATTATPVTVSWDNPSGRPAHGTWRVEWADGPTTTTMRALATGHARFLTPLDVTTLRWSRQYTPCAWAAALLTRAANNTLPDTAAEAVALADYDLHDSDAATWTTNTIRAAADLAHHNDSSPLRMATAVLTEHATRRCNEIPQATTTAPTAQNADEYRYSPPAEPGPCPNHPGCVITRCQRLLCNRPVHLLNQRGRPRRFCRAACRVAEHRRLR